MIAGARAWLWSCALIACLPVFAHSPAPPASAPPEVVALLSDTVAAYRKLKSLRQETTYTKTSTVAAAASLVGASFTARRPNRLVLEVRARTPGLPQPAITRFVCDGRKFYTSDGHLIPLSSYLPRKRDPLGTQF